MHLDGERVLIGARGTNVGSRADAGAAYIFERQPGGAWLQTQQLTAPVPDAEAEFGNKVALEGDRAVVGAWLTDATATRSGAVFVFDLGPNGWEPSNRLTNFEARPSDVLGHDVGLSNNTVVAGAFLEDNERGTNAGGARVYDLTAMTPASATFRNAGTNPPSLQIAGTHGGRPVLGGTLTLTLDVTSSGHALGRVWGFMGTTKRNLGGRMLLVDTRHPRGEVLALPLLVAPVTYTFTIPDDIVLCGLPLHVQGIHLSPQPFALSNAWDLTVGIQ